MTYKNFDYGTETDRLRFLVERDGVEGAVDFAQRTLVTYRRAVLGDQYGRDFRAEFIRSYLAFKKFLKDNRNTA